MPHYFFDAASDDLIVTDFHGRHIERREDVRPAMVEAVRAIRDLVGRASGEAQPVAGEWSLEVRLGDDNRVAAIRFDEVDAVTAEAVEHTPLAA